MCYVSVKEESRMRPLSAENGPLEQVPPVGVLHRDVRARVQEERDHPLVAVFSSQMERRGLASILSIDRGIVLEKRKVGVEIPNEF